METLYEYITAQLMDYGPLAAVLAVAVYDLRRQLVKCQAKSEELQERFLTFLESRID